MFVEVVFPIPVDKSYFYSVPEELKDKIKFGIRIKADFNNRKTYGFVIDIKNEIEDKEILDKVKLIEGVIDTEPLINEFTFKLAKWVKDYYITSLGEVLKVMIPSAIKLREPSERDFNLTKKPLSILTESQEKIYNEILKMKSGEACLIYGVTGSGKTEIYFKLIDNFIKKKSKFYI